MPDFSHPYLALPSPVGIAHRGGAAIWPQNTMTAFESAVGLGYRYLETDVQATSDNKLAVFHDDRLDPITDAVGVIQEMTWNEVSQARVGGTEPIPLLEELLDAWPDVRICIDPKTDAAVEPLIQHLRRPGVLERVCVGSFSEERLKRLDEEFGEEVCLAMGPEQIARLVKTALLKSGKSSSLSLRGNTLQIPRRSRGIPLTSRRVIDFAHNLGVAVHVWTIDDPKVMRKLLARGVDGIMTDQPLVLRDVLREKGHWPSDA